MRFSRSGEKTRNVESGPDAGPSRLKVFMLAWFSRILSWPFTGNSSKSKGKRRAETNLNFERLAGNHQHKRARSHFSDESEKTHMDPKRNSQRALFPTFDSAVSSSYNDESTPHFKVQLSRPQDEMVPISKSFLNPYQLEVSNIDSKKTEALNSLSALRGKAGSLQSHGTFQRSQALRADPPAQFQRGVPAAEILGSYREAHRTEEAQLILRQKEQQAEKNRLKDEEDEKRRTEEAERKIAE